MKMYQADHQDVRERREMEEFFRGAQKVVRRRLAGWSGRFAEDVQDAVQSTMLRLWNQWAELRAKPPQEQETWVKNTAEWEFLRNLGKIRRRDPNFELRGGELGLRNRAILEVYDAGLSVSECVKLDLAHLNVEEGTIWIVPATRPPKVSKSKGPAAAKGTGEASKAPKAPKASEGKGPTAKKRVPAAVKGTGKAPKASEGKGPTAKKRVPAAVKGTGKVSKAPKARKIPLGDNMRAYLGVRGGDFSPTHGKVCGKCKKEHVLCDREAIFLSECGERIGRKTVHYLRNRRLAVQGEDEVVVDEHNLVELTVLLEAAKKLGSSELACVRDIGRRIERLPPVYQTVWRMKIDGYPQKEIAAAIGKSEGRVSQYVKKLIKILMDEGGDDDDPGNGPRPSSKEVQVEVSKTSEQSPTAQQKGFKALLLEVMRSDAERHVELVLVRRLLELKRHLDFVADEHDEDAPTSSVVIDNDCDGTVDQGGSGRVMPMVWFSIVVGACGDDGEPVHMDMSMTTTTTTTTATTTATDTSTAKVLASELLVGHEVGGSGGLLEGCNDPDNDCDGEWPCVDITTGTMMHTTTEATATTTEATTSDCVGSDDSSGGGMLDENYEGLDWVIRVSSEVLEAGLSPPKDNGGAWLNSSYSEGPGCLVVDERDERHAIIGELQGRGGSDDVPAAGRHEPLEWLSSGEDATLRRSYIVLLVEDDDTRRVMREESRSVDPLAESDTDCTRAGLFGDGNPALRVPWRAESAQFRYPGVGHAGGGRLRSGHRGRVLRARLERRFAVNLPKTSFWSEGNFEMSTRSKKISRESVARGIIRRCEAERVRQLREGNALMALRKCVQANAWKAFSLAVKGASPKQISVCLRLQEHGVSVLLQEFWGAVQALRESDDALLAENAIFLQQSCARVKAFEQSIDAEEIHRARIKGLESALRGVLTREASPLSN